MQASPGDAHVLVSAANTLLRSRLADPQGIPFSQKCCCLSCDFTDALTLAKLQPSFIPSSPSERVTEIPGAFSFSVHEKQVGYISPEKTMQTQTIHTVSLSELTASPLLCSPWCYLHKEGLSTAHSCHSFLKKQTTFPRKDILKRSILKSTLQFT